MAVKLTSFRSESGSLHDNEYDAWIDDLVHWLKSVGIDNPGVVSDIKRVVLADIANGNHLTTIIANLKRTAPPKCVDAEMEIAA